MLKAVNDKGINPQTADEFMDTKTAAKIVFFSPASLASMRVRGNGPVFYRLGRRILYKKADLLAWREARKFSSTSDSGQAA